MVGSSGIVTSSVGVIDLWVCVGLGLWPVEYGDPMYGGLVGGVEAVVEKTLGGRPLWVCPGLRGDCCEAWAPKSPMSSKGESPLMLRPSKFSVGGEPQLDSESLEAEEA